uniref:RNA helicase n=1 Tax=Compsopogon caeruleus TaxID=31354 RepID=A0A6T6CK03_9RHOD
MADTQILPISSSPRIQTTRTEAPPPMADSQSDIAAVPRYVPPGRRRELVGTAPEATAQPPRSRPFQDQRMRLPAWSHQKEVLEAVRGSQVVVISGETGCGKTTQVPQFILDNTKERSFIICTQPRRISAVSVAERVAAERGSSIGAEVGYQIRLESQTSKETRLLFCTTGILLRRLQSDPSLNGVTHVIVDEIHERTLEADFLLIILRDLIRSTNKNVRVILMSATLNAGMFAQYFDDCPTVHIPGFTYPVTEYFLEDIIEMTGFQFRESQGGSFRPRDQRSREKAKQMRNRNPAEEIEHLERSLSVNGKRYSNSTLESLANAAFEDNISLDLIEEILIHIVEKNEDGAVLIFLPGWDDISKLCDKLKNNVRFRDASKYQILPLHSSLPTVNQRQIFERPPPGIRKIIVSTNIAETSITVDDVVFVIDSGKFKEKTYDAATNVSCLLPAFVSKASSRQRRGRAGRIQPGFCFHLFSSIDHANMEDYQLPEILRTPLESLCLQVKALKLGVVSKFLSKALEPPDPRATNNAMELLRVIGALYTDREELTPLGKHLSNFPLDPRLGKMLIYAVIFSCLDPVLTIAASLGFRNPFVMPLNRKEEADETKMRFATGLFSDHAAYLNAFCQWKNAGGSKGGSRFAWSNFLSHSSLEMIDEMKDQFLRLLEDAGFISGRVVGKYDKNSTCWPLIISILTAGLYPNIARIDFGRKRLKLLTKNDGTVKPHPGSVNKFNASFAHHWMVFYEKVKSSDLFILDSTAVPPLALCLFGGRIKVQGKMIVVDTGDDRLGLGGTIADLAESVPFLCFQTESSDTAFSVRHLREIVDTVVARHMQDPERAQQLTDVKRAIEVVIDSLVASASVRYHAAQIYDQTTGLGDELDDGDDDDDNEKPSRARGHGARGGGYARGRGGGFRDQSGWQGRR